MPLPADVASYNPFVSLFWLVTGKTVGGTSMCPESKRLDRMEALRLGTVGSAGFFGRVCRGGYRKVKETGQYAGPERLGISNRNRI